MMRRQRNVVAVAAFLMIAACVTHASHPPPQKSLAERVQHATHVVIGVGKEVRVLKSDKKELRIVTPTPSQLEMGTCAEIDIEVQEVLFPSDYKPSGLLKYRFGGGIFGVDNIKKDTIGKTCIYLLVQDEKDGSCFWPSYGWHLSESIESKDKIVRLLKAQQSFDPAEWVDEIAAMKLTLKSDKSSYVLRKPIRLLSFVDYNPTDNTSRALYDPHQDSGAVIEYHLIDENGQTKKVGKHELNPRYGWHTKDVVAPPTQFWIENRFAVGTLKFRVVLKPSAGPLAKMEFKSSDLYIAICEPQGKDKTAYELLTKAKGNRRNLQNNYFIPSSEISRSDYEFIVKNHADSIYSFYARHIISPRLCKGNDEDTYVDLLEQVVSGAPSDFPLLAETYVDLMTHYKETGYLQKAFALGEKATQEKIASMDIEATNRLRSLIEDISAQWPPKTAEQKKAADKAALLVAVQEAAKRHPLTTAMKTA